MRRVIQFRSPGLLPVRLSRLARSLVAGVLLAGVSAPTLAQPVDTESKAAIAVADSVLAALSASDRTTLARLTLDSAVVGSSGLRSGVERVSLSTWGVFINGTAPFNITERGFGASARVQDRVAHVWMPYDLYVGDTWSHCGVDVFTLMKRDGHWRVAALIYTVEQPPACEKHPAGPPAR